MLVLHRPSLLFCSGFAVRMGCCSSSPVEESARAKGGGARAPTAPGYANAASARSVPQAPHSGFGLKAYGGAPQNGSRLDGAVAGAVAVAEEPRRQKSNGGLYAEHGAGVVMGSEGEEEETLEEKVSREMLQATEEFGGSDRQGKSAEETEEERVERIVEDAKAAADKWAKKAGRAPQESVILSKDAGRAKAFKSVDDLQRDKGEKEKKKKKQRNNSDGVGDKSPGNLSSDVRTSCLPRRMLHSIPCLCILFSRGRLLFFRSRPSVAPSAGGC